jgi:hypothetical protein
MARFLAVYTIFPGDGIDVVPVVTGPPEDYPS